MALSQMSMYSLSEVRASPDIDSVIDPIIDQGKLLFLAHAAFLYQDAWPGQ